jgi:precorrin-6B C5,15-methyltransferase / cobalt-precorrin-6B C5,C15-methyltransferase
MQAELKRGGAEPWLTVVGIGEDGVAGLGEEAKRRIASASAVFGGRRHLALVEPILKAAGRPWPSPFDPELRDVLALAGTSVCVIASGDPMFFGVGATLAGKVAAGEMLVLPAPSAFSLAAARLGWPLHDVDEVSLHGRSIDLVRPLLHPGRRVVALTSDADGPPALARLLTSLGFGASRLTVLEALGGPAERMRSAQAQTLRMDGISPLNVVAIEVEAAPGARVLPRAAGLPDGLFEHDGQITKREIRALTLSALAPRRGELLWDIGAGSGSISIEWMLADPSLGAIAIESAPERARRIGRNAGACGVPGLTIIEGSAPEALHGLPRPDAIFIGGGGTTAGVLDLALDVLRPAGRLVAHAVTLEMEMLLLERHAAVGGELVRIAIAREAAVGSRKAWRPAMPVTQWIWTRP